ncbi:hypothetical protein [Reticulibacter mediterranei]|uniref:hypothetical protein n=1 Tax=Reticulibacter mediterranei TaxID=2778369 RepID=UPI001C688599|nr:hypothetical protein [Reticulibacter mediterranei]
MKQSKAEGKAEGKFEGRVEGELQAQRRTALLLVQTHFPVLLAFAQVQVNQAVCPARATDPGFYASIRSCHRHWPADQQRTNSV